MEILLFAKDPDNTPVLHVEDLVRRLMQSFPAMVIDREKGNAWVQIRLEELMKTGTPEIILESHRTYFDNVIFVSISESRWQGATAFSYLSICYPGCGDYVTFDVADTTAPEIAKQIAQDLKTAMDLVLCPELTDPTH